MTINQKQIEAVISLPAPKRYEHFVKKVVGWRKVWALYDEGWAMSETADGVAAFPLWPEKEYARLCATGEWLSYVPKSIELEEFLESLIPMMRERGILPGVFFTPEQGSVSASIDELERDLGQELSRHE